MSDFIKQVSAIQVALKAPKNQRNTFGNYNYRNCEDILEAVKPLLNGLVLTINDELIEVAGKVYVKSTATITNGKDSISNCALAREAAEQRGMSDAQITGSTSSYARKYALNGLFLIDDTKDADATNTHGKEAPAEKQVAEVAKQVTQQTTTKVTFKRNKPVPVEAQVNDGDL
jgi:hypothetical protein